MANVFIDENILQGWADTVREKTGTTDKMLPSALLQQTQDNWGTGGGDSGGINIKPVFSENDWLTIAAACVLNQVPDTWAVGDQKTMTIGGTDYAIDIIGKNHDTYTAGGNKAPLTFQLHDCYATTYQMNTSDTNTGGYDSTKMFSTHLPAIKALMPSEVQAAIRPVNKLSTIGGSASGNSATETISCDLFLLSRTEVLNITNEGSQYAYYSEGNSAVKYLNGEKKLWWLRSPYTSDGLSFLFINGIGDWFNHKATTFNYVAFAFCF